MQEAVSGDETRPQPGWGGGGQEEKEMHTAQSLEASMLRSLAQGPRKRQGGPWSWGLGACLGCPLGRAALTPLISTATSACALQLHCFLAKMTD